MTLTEVRMIWDKAPHNAFTDLMLWVSYYSSHEGKAAIYLAKVKIDG